MHRALSIVRSKINTWQKIHEAICNNSEEKIWAILGILTNARDCLYDGVERQFSNFDTSWMGHLTEKFDQRQGNIVILPAKTKDFNLEYKYFKDLTAILKNCALSCVMKLKKRNIVFNCIVS